MYSQMTDTISKLLTVEDVMANLRISRPTLYRLLKSGQLVPVRIGKRTLFDPADIRDFIEASKHATTAPEAKGPKKSGKKNESQSRKARGQKETQSPSIAPTERPAKKVRKEEQPKETASDDDDKQGRLL